MDILIGSVLVYNKDYNCAFFILTVHIKQPETGCYYQWNGEKTTYYMTHVTK